MKTAELLARYAKGERKFSWTDLRGANLRGANLPGAILAGANLRGATLTEVNLRGATLTEANLREAILTRANLTRATLCGADLTEAYLRGADLRGATLTGADLREANLTEANLSEANLSGTTLTGADLSGTCLDPRNKVETVRHDKLIEAGFEVEGDFVIGYRTRESKHVGNTVYEPGTIHKAPVFSTDAKTSCHPGLYFASLGWVKNHYWGCGFVRVAAVNGEIIHVGDKWRAKRLMILPYRDIGEMND